jgi:hypothetical protein
VELNLADACQIQQFVRIAPEIQSRDLDVGIGSDADHLLSVFLARFCDEPRHIGFP